MIWHDIVVINSNQISTTYTSRIRYQMEYCSPLEDGAGQSVRREARQITEFSNKIDK